MNTFLRGSVIALVFAGVMATVQAPAAAEAKLPTKMSAMPVPSCPPDGTTDCGIGGKNHRHRDDGPRR